jgi:hypothetical protein
VEQGTARLRGALASAPLDRRRSELGERLRGGHRDARVAGKTPFAWKVPGARISEPQFGGIVIRQGDEEHYYRRKVWSVDRSATE